MKIKIIRPFSFRPALGAPLLEFARGPHTLRDGLERHPFIQGVLKDGLAEEVVDLEALAAEKAEAERIEAERLAAEKAEAERVEAERLAAEKAEAERIEAERLAAEKTETDKAAGGKRSAGKS